MASRFGAIVPLLILMLLACISVFLGTSSGNLLIPVALSYAVAFMVLTWHRIEISLGLVLVLAPWVQDVSGGGGYAKFSAAELHIFMIAIVSVAKVILSRRPISIGKLTGPVLLYMGLSAVSAYQGGIEREDIIALFQTGIFCFILPFLFMDSNLTPTSQRNILLIAACSTVALGVFQIVAGPKAFALGIHKNNMGQGMAAGLSLWLCAWFDGSKGWWSRILVPAIAIVTIALIFTLSRGAWIGAGCALIALALMYGRVQLLVRASLVIAPLIVVMWNFLPKEDQEYASSFDRQKYDNIEARYANFDRTSALIKSSPFMGHGISIRKKLDATSLVMVTLAEGGILGFVLFIIALGTYFVIVFRIVSRIPRSDPRFIIVAASCAVMVSRLGHAQFDHYWVRGASTIAWASVGMVLAIERSVSASRRRASLRVSESVQSERLTV
jgi:O-antigen ligase